MELSQTLLCFFSAEIKERGDSYLIEVPQREVDIGDVEAGTIHRIAVVSSSSRETPTTGTASVSDRSGVRDAPPVEEGEVVDVEIEDVGDQGDGIARVGPGYVVIVPGTEMGERVSIEITDVRENMAFAEVVDHQDRFS